MSSSEGEQDVVGDQVEDIQNVPNEVQPVPVEVQRVSFLPTWAPKINAAEIMALTIFGIFAGLFACFFAYVFARRDVHVPALSSSARLPSLVNTPLLFPCRTASAIGCQIDSPLQTRRTTNSTICVRLHPASHLPVTTWLFNSLRRGIGEYSDFLEDMEVWGHGIDTVGTVAIVIVSS
ncbi:hypothetical protein B0T10DRAFT_464209 [Thelonectria olida]|uniref:Transmembrane protein n=1 Tax=Thelonectria olida TaxID=1576542 RepID=A0A9P9AHF6_9HYPO|nr:hypothetical protein B0T10DRAFT_464209 [Thelonectria olida]